MRSAEGEKLDSGLAVTEPCSIRFHEEDFLAKLISCFYADQKCNLKVLVTTGD